MKVVPSLSWYSGQIHFIFLRNWFYWMPAVTGNKYFFCNKYDIYLSMKKRKPIKIDYE